MDILAEYLELVNENQHSEAAMLLVKEFGTPMEISTVQLIKNRQEKYNEIEQCDQKTRDEIANKYYYKLKAGELKDTGFRHTRTRWQ